MDGFSSSFNDQVNGILSPLDNPPVRAALLLFLVLYGGLAAPSFPTSVRHIFDNIFFRILVLAVILWTGNKDPALSMAVATAFIASVNLANQKKPFERFENFEGPATAIFPGCMNITVYDLLESFKNDKDALTNAMLVSRVPGDVKITDYYAPLIATYLLNRGFTLKAPCSPPGIEQRTGSWV